MRLLVTGATGKVGNAVARMLVERGDDVVALVRDPDRARESVPAAAELAPGDVTDPASLRAAAQGIEGAFNCMGIFEQWLPDPSTFDRVNAEGARNVVSRRPRGGRKTGRPHLDLRRLSRRHGRHRARGRGRRLSQGNRLRALQAARRRARPHRGRARDRGRDLQPGRGLRARTVGGGGTRRGVSRRPAGPAAGGPARWHDARLRRRRRRRAIWPRSTAAAPASATSSPTATRRCASCSRRWSRPAAAAACRHRCRPGWREGSRAAAKRSRA